jgi:uncharacterized protein YoaH (UPF0181 family)
MEKTKKKIKVDQWGLTNYHYEKQEKAIEGVRKMMENPLTAEQMVAQVNAIWKKTEQNEKNVS